MNPQERYQKLEQHLALENPVLLDIIQTYKELDRIGYKTGLLEKNESYATRISWWPLISILGTFSAGKSTFINSYTGKPIQTTGNQAVDDKFTVLTYGNNEDINTLPGLALDADPRFPFFGISEEVNKVAAGEGSRIDSYLQLKTTNSDNLRGKIIIDSPGFDADSQRSSTLRITDHIIDMSDLVLVFFDARHPEPGAMRDTLEHLVTKTIDRNDYDKVLFILNQIDTAAKEDNPEEVIGSWQRALSQQGLIGGNFYAIYNEGSANIIEDPALAERFKRKKDEDLARITSRMNKVSTERAYRIANALENIAKDISDKQVPAIQKAVKSWRNKVLIADVVVFGTLFAVSGYILSLLGYFDAPLTDSTVVQSVTESASYGVGVSIAILVVIFFIHWYLRNKMATWDANRLAKKQPAIAKALLHNNRFWRGMFHKTPRGWGNRNQRNLGNIVNASKKAIQKLNDQFADPSGHKKSAPEKKPNNV